VLDRVGASATALDLSVAGSSLPLWAAAVVAALVIIAGMVAFVRNGVDGVSASLMQGAVVLMVALAGWWTIDHFARRDMLAERQALEARAFELAARAMAPGSALACLDAIAGDVVEDACEKLLFASPEATAGAVSYVAAQLSLLASAGDHARRAGPGSGMTQLRRALEADPFGLVAHVLTARDGCTPAQCGVFALLQDTRRISTNLAERTFEARLKQYAAAWPASGGRPVAATNPPPATAPQPTAAAGPRVPNNLYFPSASSIPPVNIMTAEPAAPPQPHDTTGAAADTAQRKPAPGAAPARQPPGSAAAPARSPPTPLTPPQ
jgi:hypothetical protein